MSGSVKGPDGSPAPTTPAGVVRTGDQRVANEFTTERATEPGPPPPSMSQVANVMGGRDPSPSQAAAAKLLGSGDDEAKSSESQWPQTFGGTLISAMNQRLDVGSQEGNSIHETVQDIARTLPGQVYDGGVLDDPNGPIRETDVSFVFLTPKGEHPDATYAFGMTTDPNTGDRYLVDQRGTMLAADDVLAESNVTHVIARRSDD